jgi:hypothetical protein
LFSLAVTAEKNLKPGSYAIVPCTFEAGQESSFQLMIMTDVELPPVIELIDAAVLSINVCSGDCLV